MFSGVTFTRDASAFITRSVTTSVEFWETMIATRASKGSMPAAQFFGLYRSMRVLRTRRNVGTSMDAGGREGARHNHDGPAIAATRSRRSGPS